MDSRTAALCDRLGQAIVNRDFGAAHACCAPWLRQELSPEDIEHMIDAVAEDLDYPADHWSADEGLADLEDLREPDPYGPPSQRLAREITDDNFRGWISIQFVPADEHHDEQNVCFDLWLVAVEDDGELYAGYLEAAEAG